MRVVGRVFIGRHQFEGCEEWIDLRTTYIIGFCVFRLVAVFFLASLLFIDFVFQYDGACAKIDEVNQA